MPMRSSCEPLSPIPRTPFSTTPPSSEAPSCCDPRPGPRPRLLTRSASAEHPGDVKPGDVVEGKYELVRLLGEGGMGSATRVDEA